jgi:hypothetical protein
LIIFGAGFTVFELAGCSHHSESESLLKEKRKGRCWAFACEFVGVIFPVCLHSTEAKPESLNGFMRKQPSSPDVHREKSKVDTKHPV